MSGPGYDTISFLSDYGTADEFVGVVHSVLRSLAPDVAVIDVTHQIAPHDVRAGGLALARAAQYLAPGVVLAVIDPGVGTARRGVAVEVGDGTSVLVGPDNGLLAPTVALVGGATRVVALENPDLRLPGSSNTFDGRDLFAPAAAHLCLGAVLTDLGPEIDPSSLQPGMVPVPDMSDGALVAQVLWVDRFGNAQLNVGPEDLEPLGDPVRIRVDDRNRTARATTSFADLESGEIGLLVDATGLVAAVVNQRSAAEDLAVAEGDSVTLERIDGDTEAEEPSVVTPVELGRRG